MRPHVVALGVLLVALAGCSSAPDPVFDDGGGQEVACLTHQAEAPGARYTDPEQRNTGEVLAVMRYYTANGAKPFCDDAPATDVDRAWGQFYLDMDGTQEKVPSVLG